jgi:hypothetical protein
MIMAKVKFLNHVDFGKGTREAGTSGDVPDELVDELVAAGAIELPAKPDGKKPDKS